MHLNSQCRYPDLSNLFVREDVTALVEAALIGVPDELAAQRRMLEGPLPDVAIGEHCTTPHDCPFIERCWPKLPDHHVSKDRKSTRLNSSHSQISYAVFCLKKKKKNYRRARNLQSSPCTTHNHPLHFSSASEPS